MESSGPVGAPPTPGGPSRSSANRPAEHPGDASAPPIVLLVEDDPDIAATIRSGLQAVGYQTVWALDGQRALARLREVNAAMVLLDWRLPGDLCGAALIERLRASCSYRLPVVVISGDPAALAEAVDAGCEDYLPKPFLLEDLIHVVDEHSR